MLNNISQNKKLSSDLLDFTTMEEQRFHTPNSPLSRRSPVLFDKAPIFKYLTCERLFDDFQKRAILYVSEGKLPDGTFSPFRKISQSSRYWGKAFTENTHFKFTINYTEEWINPLTNKKFKEKCEIYPVLIIDIDDFNGDFEVFAKHNLMPNYLIRNPKKPQSLQVGYVLSEPIFKAKDNSFYDYTKYDKYRNELPLIEQSPQVKFIETVAIMNQLFNGDLNFKLHNAKNPFYATEVGAIAWTDLPPYSIDELLEKALHTQRKDKSNAEQDIDFSDIKNHILTETDVNEHYIYNLNSRNCKLFDEMRFLAYEMSAEYVETNASREFYSYLFNIAAEKNNLVYGLPMSEVKATIRSIVKFCFQKRIASKYPSFQKRRQEKMNKVKNYMLETYGSNHRYSKTDKESLAQNFDISVRTVEVYASQIKKEFGNKYDEKTQMLNEIRALREVKTKWSRIAEMLGKKESALKLMYKRHLESEN